MKKLELLKILQEIEKEDEAILDTAKDDLIVRMYEGRVMMNRQIQNLILYPDVYDQAVHDLQVDVKARHRR